MTHHSYFCENAEDRYKRYKKAYDRLITYWQSELEDIYDYCIPGRNTWQQPTEGERKTNDIFDDTAVKGVQDFATNTLTFLMPPFKQFAGLELPRSVKNSGKLSDNQIQQIEANLEDQMGTLFEYLNQCGYANAFHEAFQDLAAGTGCIIINEGDDYKPFSFSSCPLSEIAVEEGPSGRLENFWRTKKYSMRQIKRIWPMAELTHDLQSLHDNQPDEEITIVEGVICYPDNEEDGKYFYYVSDLKSKADIYSEFRDYPPFLGFRYSKLSGEVMGRGPASFAIDYIRILNLLVEYDLRSAKFDAFPSYLVPSTQIINPNTTVLEPGSIIPVDSQFAGQNPIQPLPGNPNKQQSQLRIEYYQQLIGAIFASDPLPSPQVERDSTASEANIRYKEWIRKNSSSILRLQDEVIIPLFETLIKILRKKAIIRDLNMMNGVIEVKANNGQVKLVYDSPILDNQKTEDLQNTDALVSRMLQTFQQYGLMGLNYEEFPRYWAEKLNVDMDLIKSPSDVKQTIGNALQTLNQMQNQAQQPQPQQSPSNLQSILGG